MSAFDFYNYNIKQYKEDVKNLFYEVAMGKFEEISPLELKDLKVFVPLLARAFSEEAIEVKRIIDGRNIKILKK